VLVGQFRLPPEATDRLAGSVDPEVGAAKLRQLWLVELGDRDRVAAPSLGARMAARSSSANSARSSRDRHRSAARP